MSAPVEPFVILPDPNADLEKNRDLLRAVEDLDTAQAGGGSKMLGVVLAVLFVGLGGLSWGWEAVASTGVAVALHELGHVLAMRWLGYKNVRMLFIPLFGGLATGEPQTADAGKNALVALAGPLFGFITTGLIGLAGWYAGPQPWLVNFVFIALGLNAFNLLPFFPLDGGQIMNEAAFARIPRLEWIFRILASGALGLLAWLDKSWILGAVAFFNLLTVDPAYRRACHVKNFARELKGQPPVLTESLVARLRLAVLAIHPKMRQQDLDKNMPVHVKGLWLDIQKSYPGFWGSAGIVAAYFVSFLVLMPALAFLAKRGLGNPTFWTAAGN